MLSRTRRETGQDGGREGWGGLLMAYVALRCWRRRFGLPPRSFMRQALVLALAALVMPGRAMPSRAAELCWTPAQLAGRPEEARIQKNIAGAFRPVPKSASAAAAPLPASMAGKVLRRVLLPPGKKLVALTFDLCEQPFEVSGYQGDIIDILRANGVPATIFAGGKWLATHSDRADQLLADPLFEVGNHAWEHRNFRVVPRHVRLAEIDGAMAAYDGTIRRLEQRACLARDNRPAYSVPAARQRLFRFPFGACTSEAIAEVQSRGLLPVQWDVSSSDPWPGQSAAAIVSAVVARVRPGSIVLFHANGRGFKTASALPELIRVLKAQGYGFATVSQLLDTPGAVPELSPRCFDATPNDVNRYDDLARRIEDASDAFYRRFARERGAEISAQRHASPDTASPEPKPGSAPAGWQRGTSVAPAPPR